MANSTTIIADFKTVITNNNTNGVKTATAANANNATAVSATGGSGNLTGGTGVYGSGTYYGGEMDYLGSLYLCLLKAQELAVLLTRVTVNTDQATDGTNQTLLVNILNDLQ